MLAQPVVLWFRHQAMGLPNGSAFAFNEFPISSGEALLGCRSCVCMGEAR